MPLGTVLFVTKSGQREPSPLSPKVAKENRPLCHLLLKTITFAVLTLIWKVWSSILARTVSSARIMIGIQSP